MEAVPWVAWVGACTGVASLGWNIYTKVTSGARLVVTVQTGMKKARPSPPGDPTFMGFIVRNVGTVPTTLATVSLRLYDSRWERIRRKESWSCVVTSCEGDPLPYKLEVGGEWRAFMPQDGRLEKVLASGKLWCGVWHSFSSRPVEVKVASPKLQD
jgi:hypothetical protein